MVVLASAGGNTIEAIAEEHGLAGPKWTGGRARRTDE
jgi:hypothetical protein